ncbi:tax1-binding protein 1 homolog isoform X1 [Zootermopsis nevadensis]|uniref:tax1-binding protein 1 homolog isoform X1 n=1 Tax=Zootermopsis nevadensis TaxID=136037 RepID=UPI000B8EAAF7|nr:tax1-binding protein 1 homolog isoform X1 [Zootermopsis nevadensis]XP_021919021.1 tax1-binding protein 1 homolog isoform X1 [Zootermopsis nevadensis]XP_021919022.1 tax1-binding protein 1 homolog isoform X1 [Zootermopsis nevadensis]XP_021919023.1 tax1-binding protein 1 homolog isoform X1 [Zootermopsis nevadensis]XP_021919024.1 tax1-binding protein 1 homolog isoform X1 [Zootermopsis nevadensis]
MEETVSHVAERGQSLIISQSQYAKVIFHDIADTYPTDADICCRYSLTDGVTVSDGDRIALYRVGWTSVQEHIVSECVPETDATELQVLFKASQLPKDENEFYQLCYVTRNGRVRGASVPFQFCPLFESELCVVEEADGMVVVRSRTAFTEEKLREVFVANEILQKEKGNLEKELQIFKEKYHKVSTELQSAMETLAKLENEKQGLEDGLEENLRMERYVECLKQDLLVNDKEKNQCLARLNKAEHDVQVLTATVDTLSADKEFMAQLLLSENKSGGVGAEICQLKGQVDSLTCMLEALSQSKELVTQELQMQQAVGKKLQQDVQRLESESREQQNKIEELQKENVILQEQTLCAEKTSEEKIEQMSVLEKEKECLLRKLDEAVRNTEREVLMVTEVYKRRLKEVRQTSGLQTNIIWPEKKAEERTTEIVEKNHLKKDFVEAECVISESKQSLAQIMGEKASLEDNLAKALDREKKLLDHNECLATHLKELENEVSSLKLQLQMLNNECEKKAHFKEVATDLAHRIMDLKIEHKEIVANRNVQLQRIDAIAERLSELDFEKMKLCCERTDMSTFCDVREDELAKMVENLTSLERRQKNSYLMGSFSDSSDAESLKESVDELLSFVASYKMRITEIDQQMKELEDETSVLLQQQSDALERKNEFKLHEEELHNKLIELQERESEMVQEQADQLVTLHNQLDHTLNQNSEMLATGCTRKEKLASAVNDKAKLQQKLEELSRLQEQQSGSENALEMNTCLEEEQQLKSRLQLAAVEYKKLYTEKQKVERRLAKLCHKLNNKRGKPLPASEQSEAKYQPATGELISLTGYSDEFQE